MFVVMSRSLWGISEDNHIKIDHSLHFLSFGFVIFVCVYKLNKMIDV